MKFTVICLLLYLLFAWKKNRSIELAHIHTHTHTSIPTNLFQSIKKKGNEYLLQHNRSGKKERVHDVKYFLFFYPFYSILNEFPHSNIFFIFTFNFSLLGYTCVINICSIFETFANKISYFITRYWRRRIVG